MNDLDRKQSIESCLKAFGTASFRENALSLFETLGYKSERRYILEPNTATQFFDTFAHQRAVKPENALLSDWKTVDFLFQLTDAEVQKAGQEQLEFDSKGKFDGSVIESYLFIAIDLNKERYTRTQLSSITRSVNRLFDMPVMVLYRHGDAITLAIIRRRLHKRDESRDVLDKVTLIKDIKFSDPLRAHIEILNDLSLSALYDEFYLHNFVGLHQAWEKRLDSYALNERFYREVANWYFWALQRNDLVYPRNVKGEEQRSIFLIRLLTRLIFCWFLQEKGLIPRDLFRRHYVNKMLADFSPDSGTYYQAFLQNLFFATLNQERDNRGFRKKYKGTRDGNRGITTLYRYADLLKTPDAFIEMLQAVPFVNGGLFDCLDDVERKPNIRIDDFSEEKDNKLCLPNDLFYGEEREVDLSAVYDDSRRKREHVQGLIEILGRYKFTVEENTPLEQEIALDPELLGKVFENLLASYNEETRTTARKATGSYYTRREIVNYMVDEALLAYLKGALPAAGQDSTADIEARLRQIFSADAAHFENPLAPKETERLIAAIDQVKILDPACGSGAFPMGALHRLVDLLQKLDPNNSAWKRKQLAKAQAYCEFLQQANAPQAEIDEVDNRIADVERSFDSQFHALDFARKLYLIENCIYGVDIQPIACQIAKLRFFIALIVDQNVNDSAPNRGVRALPNLETKIVAADTLTPIERPEEHQFSLVDFQIRSLREKLENVRHDYFMARTPATKAKCRQRDAELRQEISEVLRENGWPTKVAKAMAGWDPYDQNTHAKFFDSEWMFGIPVRKVRKDEHIPATLLGHFSFVNELSGQLELTSQPNEIESGFDVVIGNPPYIRIQTLKQKDPELVKFLKEHYASASKGNYDVYVVFVERGMQLLKPSGNLAYILPHKFFNSQYGEQLRGLIGRGRYLNHVVHFGDLQVFPGAANYVCLLFLNKLGVDSLKFVQVKDLAIWLNTAKGIEAIIPSSKIGSEPWNFVVGQDISVISKLDEIKTRLGTFSQKISQGIRTSANDVFVLDIVEERKNLITAFSTQLNREVIIEREMVSLFLQGKEIKPYIIQPSGKIVIIPYGDENGRVELISLKQLRQKYPNTYEYLLANKRFLENREDGRMRGEAWYGYIYPKNLEVMRLPKLIVPDIADRASFALDAEGNYAFTSGYGIILKPTAKVSLEFILGLVNSRVLDYYWRKISTSLRGGFYRYFTQFIEQLPIPSASEKQHEAICKITEYILWLQNKSQTRDIVLSDLRDPLMLGYFEQVINGLVYELFFPEELHSVRLYPCELVEEAQLPKLKDISDSQRLNILRKTFEQLYDTNHPLRGCLFSLRSLESVRIIEGQE